MNDADAKVPWWLGLQLWSVDVFAATLSWGVAVAALMEVTMPEEGPLLLLGVAGWMASLMAHLWGAVRGDGWFVRFYRSHMAPMVMLTVGVGLAAVWLAFFYVGQSLLSYAVLPVFLLLLAYGLTPMSHVRVLRGVGGVLRDFLLGLSYAQACVVPACYFCFSRAPMGVASVWYFAVLMGLYFMLRRTWRQPEADTLMRDVIVSAGLLLIMVAALSTSLQAHFFERAFCVMVAMGCACLQVLTRLRGRIPQAVLFAVSWLVMALPPIICVVLYAPESW